MCSKTAVFIDGPYLDHVAKDCGSPRLDIGRVAGELARPDDLLRTYYYHALPYLGPMPSEEDLQQYDDRQRFFRALTRTDRIQLREGRVELLGTDRESDRPIFEHRRLSLPLAIDLVRLAVKQRISRAVLVTGDSGVVPALRAARDEGVVIRLCHGTGPQMPALELWEEADERTVITADLLRGATTIAPSHGAERPYRGSPEYAGMA